MEAYLKYARKKLITRKNWPYGMRNNTTYHINFPIDSM